MSVVFCPVLYMKNSFTIEYTRRQNTPSITRRFLVIYQMMVKQQTGK